MLTIPITYIETPIKESQRPKRWWKKPSEKYMDKYLRKIERLLENDTTK